MEVYEEGREEGSGGDGRHAAEELKKLASDNGIRSSSALGAFIRAKVVYPK